MVQVLFQRHLAIMVLIHLLEYEGICSTDVSAVTPAVVVVVVVRFVRMAGLRQRLQIIKGAAPAVV